MAGLEASFGTVAAENTTFYGGTFAEEAPDFGWLHGRKLFWKVALRTLYWLKKRRISEIRRIPDSFPPLPSPCRGSWQYGQGNPQSFQSSFPSFSLSRPPPSPQRNSSCPCPSFGDGKGLDSFWSFNSRHTIASKPMKNLTPPGLIATGIPWLEYGPGQATLQSPFASPRSRSPSPVPQAAPALPAPLRMERGRPLNLPAGGPPSPLSPLSPLRPVRPVSPNHLAGSWPSAPIPACQVHPPSVTRTVSQATSVPAPIPIAPSSEATQTARSNISRMTTNPCVGRVVYLPPITIPSGQPGQTETPASRSRSISPLRSPTPGISQAPRIISDIVIPGMTSLKGSVEEKLYDAVEDPLPTTEVRLSSLPKPNSMPGSDTSTDAPGHTPPAPALRGITKVFRRGLHPGERAQVESLLLPAGESELRHAACQEFRWALESGGRARGETIDLPAALTVSCTGNGGLAENSPSCYGGQFLVEKFSLHVLSYDGSTGIVDMKAEGPQSAECDGAEFQSDDNMITIENDQGCGLSNYEYTVRYCPDQDHVIVNLVKPYNARVVLQSQTCPSAGEV
ncbi:NLRC3 [Symbiodinium sp. KB8]|nr:NLRC3 [Symbiodinium sp. KB8]